MHWRLLEGETLPSPHDSSEELQHAPATLSRSRRVEKMEGLCHTRGKILKCNLYFPRRDATLEEQKTKLEDASSVCKDVCFTLHPQLFIMSLYFPALLFSFSNSTISSTIARSGTAKRTMQSLTQNRCCWASTHHLSRLGFNSIIIPVYFMEAWMSL